MARGRLQFTVSALVVTLGVGASALAEDSDKGVQWHSELSQAVRLAKRTDRPVLITFSASWCGPCLRMHRETFSDERVVEEINTHFVPVLLDADEHAGLVEQMNIEALPASVLVVSDKERAKQVTGFRKADEFLKDIRKFRARHVAGRAQVRS